VTRAIPNVTVNELAGFLEHLAGQRAHRRIDIYQVENDLPMDSDHVLRLAETAERLGFALLDHRDVSETPLGETFADASIQARKEIFSTRVRRVPIVNWLLTMLEPQTDMNLRRTSWSLRWPRLPARGS
jgi:NitT/TauT family transport system ATP-binding protein